MGNWRKAFPSKYLKAEDLTRPTLVEIESVGEQDVGSGAQQESKLVVHFVNMTKGLVLNLINASTIAEIAVDDDYDRWPNHVVELYPTRTEFQGKRVPCIRVREPSEPSQRPATVETSPY